MVPKKALEDQADMSLVVFRVPGVDEDVIKIDKKRCSESHKGDHR